MQIVVLADPCSWLDSGSFVRMHLRQRPIRAHPSERGCRSRRTAPSEAATSATSGTLADDTTTTYQQCRRQRR